MDSLPSEPQESPRILEWVTSSFPSPVDLPYTGIEPRSLELQANYLPIELSGKEDTFKVSPTIIKY